MKPFYCFLLASCLSSSMALAQQTEIEKTLPATHPRYYTTQKGKSETQRLIDNEPWAKNVFAQLRNRADKYVQLGEDWLSSRLMMYWDSHATDVFIKGEYVDHAGGDKAPAPTPMLSGARSHATNYARPSLEEIEPYQEDSRGLYLANNTIPGKPKEWTHISRTGNTIQSINREISERALEEAFLWWMTGDESYAKVAARVFDTYMTGIYYRNVPYDLNHGHQQTLVGMSSFEVIHEDILTSLVPTYDFLYDYLKEHYADKMEIYAEAFKKWANNIIDNGVPHNNWNFMQAHFIMDIAMVLEDNQHYSDGKGRGYYLDYILHQSSIRQWSLPALAAYGYDANTGIWAECPGYSSVVLNDMTSFASLYATSFNYDLINDIPVIKKAVKAFPQYLFPDKKIIGFGDTHPDKIKASVLKNMIVYAQHFGKKDLEAQMTAMLKCFYPEEAQIANSNPRPRVAVSSFFSEKPLVIDSNVPAGEIDDMVTPTFYAPNASWLVMRNGMDQTTGLMVALNASEGNHMHANGISMELYGKGYRLAPDGGIGYSLYSGLDYAEYYSQFPSHNTVCVDGVSSYPVMKSNHAFRMNWCYPAVGEDVDYAPVSCSQVYFLEPESQADQQRTLAMVRSNEHAGYYIDVFRSKKQAGGDKTHDYFYHNMGQEMTLTAANGSTLNLQPTQELAFAGAHLYAYSYIYDKTMAQTSQDVRATYCIKDAKEGNDITMNMWMKGESNRRVFKALSPSTEGLCRMSNMPYDIKEQPTLTFIARQQGEAWNHPFIAIYEPVTKSEPTVIKEISYPTVDAKPADGSHQAIVITKTDGSKDYVITSDDSKTNCSITGMSAKAGFAFANEKYLLLCDGTSLQTQVASITLKTPGNVSLEKRTDGWYYSATEDCLIKVDGHKYSLKKQNDMTAIR